MKEVMLTTTDNPFSPFDQFEEWLAFDRSRGYHTSTLLARIASVSLELSEVDYHFAIDKAIDDIIRDIPVDYVKVTREIKKSA